MSLVAAIARIEELQSAFAPRDITPVQSNASGGASVPSAVTASASSANSFSNLLNGALGGNTNPALTMPISSPGGAVNGVNPILSSGGVPVSGGAQRMLALAQGEVGQAEYPPGSNDSPRIATYRQATAGSGVGPWCAYFVSWLGQQSGTPLGESGQGFGRVDDVYAWAQSTGRAVPNGPGVVPNPGDLIVWDEHIGMVEQVLPDGRVQTIEGNSSDKVSRNVHEAGSALGYVRMS